MAGKGLRRLLSEEPPIEELQSVFNQAANDTNDRAAALISASLLDGALQRAIEARLWLDKMEVSEKLFGGRGGEPIIGSFGAKISAWLCGFTAKKPMPI
jgi:hypothetical protein